MLRRFFQPRLRSSGLALACAGLALGPLADVEPDQGSSCALPGASARVYEGSRLFDTRDGRLGLSRGRLLACTDPAARGVLSALEKATGAGIGERLAAPLRVHLDPDLPARQAPLRGIEVHVSSREILVERAALAELPERAWRHEVLHALAATPPPLLSRAGRQLWLTLEEGVVAFSTDVGAGRAAEASAADADGGPRLLPLIEWLESSAYDPHALAAGLARELEGTGADASAFLDCLARAPAWVQHRASSPSRSGAREATAESAPTGLALPGAEQAALALPQLALPVELADVFAAFGARCAAGAQAHWAAALERWWGPPPAPPGGERVFGKAAARALESR